MELPNARGCYVFFPSFHQICATSLGISCYRNEGQSDRTPDTRQKMGLAIQSNLAVSQDEGMGNLKKIMLYHVFSWWCGLYYSCMNSRTIFQVVSPWKQNQSWLWWSNCHAIWTAVTLIQARYILYIYIFAGQRWLIMHIVASAISYCSWSLKPSQQIMKRALELLKLSFFFT